jgi:hypothetical protein
LSRWAEAAAELAELRTKMHRVMARLAMRAAAGAFARWKEMAAEAGAYTRPLFSST